jgi:glutamate dehydrogenase
MAGAIAVFASGAAVFAEAAPALLPAADLSSARQTSQELADGGVPSALASRVAHLQMLVPALDLVELAAETGLSFEEVAGVYFAVDERLDLHVLRHRIAALPREERWDALARRALWEDLQNEQRALAADVLRESGGGPGAERVRSWVERNAAPVERCAQVLADVKAGGTSDLATLSVAVREIRNLIESSPAQAAHVDESIRAPLAPVTGP